jgi:methyl-accepting chemotaxis protein
MNPVVQPQGFTPNLSEKVTELASDRMVKVRQFTDLLDNLNEIGRAVRNIVIAADDITSSAEMKRIEERRAENSQLLATLDKTIVTPEARALLGKLTESREIYNRAMYRAIDAAIKGDKVAAASLLLGDVRTAQKPVFDSADAFSVVFDS